VVLRVVQVVQVEPVNPVQVVLAAFRVVLVACFHHRFRHSF